MMIAKKTQLLAVAAAFLIPIGAQANDIEPLLDYFYADPANPIIVDGDLSEWSGVKVLEDPRFSIPKGSGDGGTLVMFEEHNGGSWEGIDDFSSALQIAYDDDNVYVGIVVTDDYHENAANSPWNGDSVQLMIANDARDTQIALYNYALGGVEGSLGDIITQHQAGPGGTEAVVTRDTQKQETTYEIRVPKASLALDELTPGVQFGLGMAINDGDEDTPGQRGWGGLGAHSIVFGKTPQETALITLVRDLPDPPVSNNSSNISLTDLNQLPITYYELNQTDGPTGARQSNLGTRGPSADGRIFGNARETPGPGLPGFGTDNFALGVDGQSASGVIVQQAILDGLQEVTISFWVQIDELLGDRTGLVGQDDVIELGFSNPNTIQSWNEVDSTTDGTFKYADFNAQPLKDGEWHHVANSTDAAGNMSLYIDGEKQPIVGGANSDVSLEDLGANNLGTSGKPFYIGGGQIFGQPFDTWFNGSIDAVAVFDRALSEAEIREQYAAAFTTGTLDGDVEFISNLFDESDLPAGTKTSLNAKLKEHNNLGSQIHALEALVHQVDALSGKKIGFEDAEQIREASLRAIKLYGGQSHVVPEPSGLILLAVGLLSVAMLRTNQIRVTR